MDRVGEVLPANSDRIAAALIAERVIAFAQRVCSGVDRPS